MSNPRAADARIGGASALAAAAPILFAPLAALALAAEQADPSATMAAVAGAAPLAIVAGLAVAKPRPSWVFAWAAIPLAITAAAFAWLSVGGLRSPAAPWALVALTAVALYGGRRVALVAGALGLTLGALYLAFPEPPARLFGRAPLAQREIASFVSWIGAFTATAAVAYAAVSAWISALPPLRHPTIAARRALALLSETAAVCGLRVGRDGAILGAHGALEQTLGFGRDELNELALDSLLHPDDVATARAMLEEAREANPEPAEAAAGAPSAAPERSTMLRIRSRQGGYRWIEAHAAPAAPYPAPKSKTPATVVDAMLVCRARWRPGRETGGANDAERAAFLAQMSDDLRGSLKSIVGFTDILRNELFGSIGNDRNREYARLAHEAGLHLLEQVDELIDLAEIEAGRFSAEAELADLTPLVEGATRLVRMRAEQLGVAVRVETPRGAPRIKLQRRALRRVLVTMMLDALRRAEMGDALKLSAELDEDALRFSVHVQRRAGHAAGIARAREASAAAREHSDWASAPDLRSASDARMGRLVVETLGALMGGGLIFTDEEPSDRGFDGDLLQSELLLPAPERAPEIDELEEAAAEDDASQVAGAAGFEALDAALSDRQGDLFDVEATAEPEPAPRRRARRDDEDEALETPLFELDDTPSQQADAPAEEAEDATPTADGDTPEDAATEEGSARRRRRLSA